MTNPADLVIKCGEDWTATMTYRRAGEATRVDQPVAEIREARSSSSALVLRMDSVGESPIITQAQDGVMIFRIPHAITSALKPGSWCWDFFGVVAGDRKKLVDIATVEIGPSVTSDS